MRTSLVGVSRFACPRSHVNVAECAVIRQVPITQARFSGSDLSSRSLSGLRRLGNEEVLGFGRQAGRILIQIVPKFVVTCQFLLHSHSSGHYVP
jgi:hypothetical protein